MRGYPNLELIEYKCKENAMEKYSDVLQNALFLKCKMDVFMQTWANTATGFDLKSYASGQAFTDEYTTVCELSWCKRSDDKYRFIDVEDRIYCVFFGNEMAYIVINPSEQFFDDLKNRKMKSQREALKEYKEGYMVKKDDC